MSAPTSRAIERAWRPRTERGFVVQPPLYDRLRLTIPAQEALMRGSNRIRLGLDGDWRVMLRRPPAGLVLVLVGERAEQRLGLRIEREPRYPGEWPASAVAWHERGCWTPCPVCGAALVWYEAGYVPGYRICLSGHHSRLSADGRSARAIWTQERV